MKSLILLPLLMTSIAFAQGPSIDSEMDEIESAQPAFNNEELPPPPQAPARPQRPASVSAKGGVMKVPHPGAAKGLLRINKDGSYQYRTALRPKSQALSVRLGAMTPPDIYGNAGVTFKKMYGSANLFALHADYEWQPIKTFGSLGVQVGMGFATATGSGTLAGGGTARENYNIFIVPMSAFGVYRFEYVRRQWVVPFVNGGLTYYGLAEKRDDDAAPVFAGAAAVGGGGGVHISISRLDPAAAFTLDREYGVADMWFTLEARVMQGLDQETDFTSQMITGGITIDY